MARTRQTNRLPSRHNATYEALAKEARGDRGSVKRNLEPGPNHGDSRRGHDNVTRKRLSAGRMLFLRFAAQTPVRVEWFKREDGTTVGVAVYKSDHVETKGVRATRGPQFMRPKNKPGKKALREIKLFQGRIRSVKEKREDGSEETRMPNFHGKTAVETLIPKLAFQKLVREIFQDVKSDLRITADALAALQCSAEAHVVEYFQDSNLCALHCGRETVRVADMRLAGKVSKDRRLPTRAFFEDSRNQNCYARKGTGQKKLLQPPEGLYRGDGVAETGWV